MKIEPIKGYVLMTREDTDEGRKAGDWYICWHEIFDKRIDAIGFATRNAWRKPWKAVRGSLATVLLLLLFLTGCTGDNIPFNPNDLDPCLRSPPIGKC